MVCTLSSDLAAIDRKLAALDETLKRVRETTDRCADTLDDIKADVAECRNVVKNITKREEKYA